MGCGVSEGNTGVTVWVGGKGVDEIAVTVGTGDVSPQAVNTTNNRDKTNRWIFILEICLLSVIIAPDYTCFHNV